jgi:predicted transcriptional regulator
LLGLDAKPLMSFKMLPPQDCRLSYILARRHIPCSPLWTDDIHEIPDLILGSEWSASCVSKDAAQRTACTQFVLGEAVFTLWQLTEGQSPIVCIDLNANTSHDRRGAKVYP